MSDRKAKGGRNRIPTPHDLAFKQFLTHPDTTRDFMQLHLPADLLDNLATLLLTEHMTGQPLVISYRRAKHQTQRPLYVNWQSECRNMRTN